MTGLSTRRAGVGSWWAEEWLPALGLHLGGDDWLRKYRDGVVVIPSLAAILVDEDDLEPVIADLEEGLGDQADTTIIVDDRPIPPILDPLEIIPLRHDAGMCCGYPPRTGSEQPPPMPPELDRSRYRDPEPELESPESLNPRPARKRKRVGRFGAQS